MEQICSGIAGLRSAIEQRLFTIDGRLIADIGEALAELDYDLSLDPVSERRDAATATDGRRV